MIIRELLSCCSIIFVLELYRTFCAACCIVYIKRLRKNRHYQEDECSGPRRTGDLALLLVICENATLESRVLREYSFCVLVGFSLSYIFGRGHAMFSD